MTLFSRRSTLGLLLGAPALLWVGPASAQAERSAPVPSLITVFLRGAMDGLSLLVPHSDPSYYRYRPSIAVARPGQPGGALDLDGRFGIHPRLAPLLPAFQAKELALVTSAGSPHPTRSHFEAQDNMESGAEGAASVRRGGWLGRALSALPANELGLLPALALSEKAPLALRGFGPAVSTRTLADFHVRASAPLLEGFDELYADGSDPATLSGRRALDVSQRLVPLVERQGAPENGARYPKNGRAFREIAALIKASVGLRAAWIDLGGWDTHRNQGNGERGELATNFDVLGSSLAALRADLGARFADVVVVVMSEFGRTARQNGSGGTDHGHGSALLVIGGEVNGGKIYGTFDGLAVEHLHERRDLPVATDYRDVLAELCERQLGVSDTNRIFPGYAFKPANRLGLLRA
jgi:uncharacterized protein (DUF1501 family)